MSDMTGILGSFRPDLFAGQRAIVVGATSGIGLEIARGLAGLGAEGHRDRKLRRQRIGGGFRGEARSSPFRRIDVAGLRARCTPSAGGRAGGRWHILVNCGGHRARRGGMDEAIFLDTIEVKSQRADAVQLRHCITSWRGTGGGSVVNIASMLSFLADPGVPAYLRVENRHPSA